jgi:predicted permease
MFSRLRAFWKALTSRSRMEVAMDAELRFHMEAYTEDLVRTGVPRAEAERRARLEFGGVESTKVDCCQALGLRLVDDLRQDVRYAARSLRRSPGFTAVAVITLALGIGATTAIFTYVDAVLFKPLAYREADRLVVVRDQTPPGGDTDPPVPVYLEWKGQNQVFSSMASVQYGNRDVNLTGGPNGFALRARALSVSAGFFELVGVPPVLGRSFLPGEDQPGAESVMVISNRLWRNTFSSDPEIVGKSIRVNGLPCTMAGVLPPGVFDRGTTDLWMPWVFAPREISSYQPLGSCNVLARLKPGVTLEQASAEMQRVAEAVNRENPEPSRKGYTARVVPLRDTVAGTELRRMLLLFQGAVFLLLLIACVNVANLTMARAASR